LANQELNLWKGHAKIGENEAEGSQNNSKTSPSWEHLPSP